MKNQPERRVGESIPFREAYRGPRTWYIPPTHESYRSGLPEGLTLSDLTEEEIKAAIDLNFIEPSVIDQEITQAASGVSKKRAAKAAKSLLEKMAIARAQ